MLGHVVECACMYIFHKQKTKNRGGGEEGKRR
jgi:hypothetical protein